MSYTLMANSTSVRRDSDNAMIPNDPANLDWVAYQTWLGAGNTPSLAPSAPEQVPSCQLWQLQAVLTAAQGVLVQNAVATLNNPAVSAFFAHGTNVIPANSTTLGSLATAIGIDPSTLPTLIAEAAAIAIP